MFKSILCLLAAASSVAAHGYVSSVTIDGKEYKGNQPNSGRTDSAIRLISDISPVKGADNPSMKCGFNAKRSDDVADANPGSTLEFDWSNGQWPHNTGPIITYMASCGDQSCADFDSSNAEWFKIDEQGKKDNGNWVQQDLMDGKTVSVQIPQTLQAGNYLVRHEIIALHLATSQGGAEFYPSCTQLRVGGNENGQPSQDELVNFPGAYSDTDPGILVPDVYNARLNYQFPGPDVTRLAGTSGSPSNGGNSGGSSSAKPSSTKSSSGSQSQPTGTNTHIKTGSCTLKKSKRAAAPDASNDNFIVIPGASHHGYRPRHVSRIMRDLVFPKH